MLRAARLQSFRWTIADVCCSCVFCPECLWTKLALGLDVAQIAFVLTSQIVAVSLRRGSR